MRFVERGLDEESCSGVDVLVFVAALTRIGRGKRGRDFGGPLRDEGSASVEVAAEAASARAKRSGNVFPRRSARRRIPAHALGLKKYRSGSGSGSKMSDKETTLASLGHSEELSVQHSPRAAIPELAKGPEKTPEGVGVVGQNSGDVLPEEPPRAKRLSQSRKLEREVAALVSESATEPGDGEGLAGGSSGEEVDAALVASKSS